MEYGAYDEMQCWRHFRDGDREAFAALYRRHIVSLLAYGVRLCPDRDLLKDQIQELFVELWHSRKNLSPTRSVKFYLLRALRYKLIRLEKSHYARRKNTGAGIDLDALLEDSVEANMIENETHASQEATLREAIKTLSLRQQEAIQLRYYQGLSHDEIAELMDLNYQSVSNLLHRALQRLKNMVKSPVFHLLPLLLLLQ
jgi:RNA polymerase sigma factor (sigma-70 family)